MLLTLGNVWGSWNQDGTGLGDRERGLLRYNISLILPILPDIVMGKRLVRLGMVLLTLELSRWGSGLEMGYVTCEGYVARLIK